MKPARELGRFSIWKGGDETGQVKHRVVDRLMALGGSSGGFVYVCKPMIEKAVASSR